MDLVIILGKCVSMVYSASLRQQVRSTFESSGQVLRSHSCGTHLFDVQALQQRKARGQESIGCLLFTVYLAGQVELNRYFSERDYPALNWYRPECRLF